MSPTGGAAPTGPSTCGGAVAVPASASSLAPAASLLAIVRVAFRAPAAVGTKRPATVQDSPSASGRPKQPLAATAKSDAAGPLTVTPETLTARAAGPLNVIVFVGPPTPTAVDSNARADGVAGRA